VIFQWNLAHPNLVCAQEIDEIEEFETHMLEEDEEEEGEEVEAILDLRSRGRGKQKRDEFKVRWVGHGSDSDTWEPRENLVGSCDDTLKEFEDAR
jgi:hypothetical protein